MNKPSAVFVPNPASKEWTCPLCGSNTAVLRSLDGIGLWALLCPSGHKAGAPAGYEVRFETGAER